MLTILIVDDKPENIFALESLLERPDRRFLHAENGKQCLKVALQEEIHLIVLDVQMPEMDGFEVAQILKSNNRTKDIPIIFASAEKKEQQFMMKGFEEGAVDYLFKPLDPEITKAKVSVLLKLQHQKKELLEKNMALEQSALLINNSADIIGILDPATWKFVQVNPAFAATLGYTAEEVKELSVPSVLSEAGSLPLIDVASMSDRLSFETPVHTKHGEEKYLQWHVVVKDQRWFVNVRDITSQRKAEESISRLNDTLRENLAQLESANKELESFSYSVSHDLRAPLRSMDGYTKILQEEYGDRLDGEGKRYLSHILNNTRKMGNLIDDLLKFSRMGRKDIQKSEVAVERLVKSMLSEMISANGVAAEVKLGELPPVHADYSLLTQVWTNLLSNALKYSSKSERPVVEVGSERQNGEVIYYVRDNGVGFDMRYADKLFGVFQRMHKPEDFEGTGVGLAIVQRIVVKHGGRVWATAEVNKGATFYFALPDRKQA